MSFDTSFLIPEKTKHIAVLGDMMLDVYERGHVMRLNPESPASHLLESTSTSHHLGGAANVAHNLLTLGASVSLYGLIGEDFNGDSLQRLLDEQSITYHLYRDGRRTTTKTRFVEDTRNHQVLRFDVEDMEPLSDTLASHIMQNLSRHLDKIDAVVCSDYTKGFFTNSFAHTLIAACSQRSIPVLVDTKPNHVAYFRGATALKPNLGEAEKMTGLSLEHPLQPQNASQFQNFCATLQSITGIPYVFVTCGEQGLFGMNPKRDFTYAPTHAQKIYDVTGAGDTVMAVLALAFATHYKNDSFPMHQTMRLANLAAGIVISKPGTSTLTLEELLAATQQE